MSNKNLNLAKKAKNDEFYTQLSDVAKELMHYKPHFKDKVVFCNCDDPAYSAFWRYFHLNFHELGLKKLIATHYDKTEPTYKMEYDGTYDNDLYPQDIDNDINIGIKTPLQGNGDFRNQECLDLLDECDIVCTNPPFSLWCEFINAIIEHNKQFLIIGNYNAIMGDPILSLIKENKVWIGVTPRGAKYEIPKSLADTYKSQGRTVEEVDGKYYFGVNSVWYTNMWNKRRAEELILWKKYNPHDYPKYDNYDCINVDRVKDIPCDYFDVMGVPITFFDKYCPDQFELVGITDAKDNSPEVEALRTDLNSRDRGVVNGQCKYARILVRRVKK